ncbi:MAG TPA: hypothetical protein VIM25_03275 [Candidatus Limnocylindrales bacterium]
MLKPLPQAVVRLVQVSDLTRQAFDLRGQAFDLASAAAACSRPFHPPSE